MIDTSKLKLALSLLSREERRESVVVLVVALLSAISSAAMVLSIFPFLSVLSDPAQIQENEYLRWGFEISGFDSEFEFVFLLGFFSILVILFANLFMMANTYIYSRFYLMRTHSLGRKLLKKYLQQDYQFFLSKNSSDLSKNVLSESEQVVSLFFSPLVSIVTASVSILFTSAALFWLNPTIAFFSFAVVGGAYFGVFSVFKSKFNRMGKVRAEANQERYRVSGEVLGGVKDVKIIGCEEAYIRRFEAPSYRMAKTSLMLAITSEAPKYIMQSVAFCGVIIFCLFLIDRDSWLVGGSLSTVIPTLGVFAFAGQKMLPEVQKLYSAFSKLQYGLPAIDRFCKELETASGDGSLTYDTKSEVGFHSKIELKELAYQYPQAELPGLSAINITVKAGERIGIVGSTGAGKTTLADVILGLLRPTAGAIYVDGVEITDDKVRAWQRSVGYVPQNIFLLDASVAENVALGLDRDEIDMERVKLAAQIAQLSDFVENDLPEGYETEVGERGVRLSGGQRQRIGIARALYRNADLIVFDEATSALDNLTEHEVIQSVNALPGSKTILMIAHRLSTIRGCDRIIVLDKGRLVGFGPWDELMAGNEAFQKIARLRDNEQERPDDPKPAAA